MRYAADDALTGIRIQSAEELLPASGAAFTEQAWFDAVVALGHNGRSVLPRRMPAGREISVLTYPLNSTFGPLLSAATRFMESGDEKDAQQTAYEAGVLKSLTTVPHLRFERQATAPASSSPQESLSHRISAEGNGFLVMTAGELARSSGSGKWLGMAPRPQQADPAAYVVIWDRMSAPGLVLTGVCHAYAGIGVASLKQYIATAAQALVPGRDEWLAG
ncbi:hypothetical protein ACNPQN_32745 [Streptomyces sp. NPDC056297]|uniref:hypothetical protein n=1 Tax=unclassified Streptomyces TaxID=2593676 RepID=UPI0035DD304D